MLVAGRSAGKVEDVVADLRSGGASAEGVVFDLADLGSVRASARSLVEAGEPIHALVNNAGIGIGNGHTLDGFELHWSVNHLGHFLLTRELGPLLGSGARVVTVSSDWHYRARSLHFDRVRRRGRSPFGLGLYAETKTANILFTRELARRRPELSCHAVHPGVVDTGIFPVWVRPFLGGMLTPEQGADTVVWCALSDEVGPSGSYYARRTAKMPSPLACDDDLALELWEKSEEWVN